MSAITPSPVFSTLSSQYRPMGAPATSAGPLPVSPPQPVAAPAQAGTPITPGVKQYLLTTAGLAYVSAAVVKTAIQLVKKQPLQAVLPWTLLYGTITAAALSASAMLKLRSGSATPTDVPGNQPLQ